MKASDRIRRAIEALDACLSDDDMPLCAGLIADARRNLVRARDENVFEEKEAEEFWRDQRELEAKIAEDEARGYIAADDH